MYFFHEHKKNLSHPYVTAYATGGVAGTADVGSSDGPGVHKRGSGVHSYHLVAGRKQQMRPGEDSGCCRLLHKAGKVFDVHCLKG